MEEAKKHIRFKSDLHPLIDKILADAQFSGSVHIMRDGITIYHQTSGWADYENHVPFTDRTTMPIASLSKQITAAGIMLLVEQGKLQPDTTIDKFIPDYSYAKLVTIRHLLNHSSGIMDYTAEILLPDAIKQREKELGRELTSPFEVNKFVSSLARAYSLEECLELVNDRPLHFAPGEGTAYSNTNYHFLSDIIERIMDMPCGEYLSANIFKVLGMEDSHTDGLKADAKAYIRDAGGNILVCGKYALVSGDSGVISNIKDMECWCSAILNRKLLRPESWDQCFHLFQNRFGFGFQKFDQWLGHNGGMPGISARERLHPESKTGIIILSNTTSPGQEVLKNILECIEL